MRDWTTDEQKDAYIAYLLQQLDRMTGGGFVAPDPVSLVEQVPRRKRPGLEPDVVAVVAAAIQSEDVYRKPGRVAAPRLLERLAEAGVVVSFERGERASA